jgi:hypothetical protein
MEELRCIFGSSGQQCIAAGDEDLALWSKSKKKVDKGARQGPRWGPSQRRVVVGKRET